LCESEERRKNERKEIKIEEGGLEGARYRE